MELIWVKRLFSKAQQSSGVRGIWQGGVLALRGAWISLDSKCFKLNISAVVVRLHLQYNDSKYPVRCLPMY